MARFERPTQLFFNACKQEKGRKKTAIASRLYKYHNVIC